MSQGLTSAGIKISYSVETAAGTRPTTASAYTPIAGLKEIPDMNPQPDALETTTFDDTVYKTYTQGLKDLGGTLGFNFNLTSAFVTAWESLISAYTTGATTTTPLATWFCIEIPNISKALYFTGEPAPLGLSGTSVNSVLEITAYIVPSNQPVWATKPTS